MTFLLHSFLVFAILTTSALAARQERALTCEFTQASGDFSVLNIDAQALMRDLKLVHVSDRSSYVLVRNFEHPDFATQNIDWSPATGHVEPYGRRCPYDDGATDQECDNSFYRNATELKNTTYFSELGITYFGLWASSGTIPDGRIWFSRWSTRKNWRGKVFADRVVATAFLDFKCDGLR